MREITLSRDMELAIVTINIGALQGCRIPSFGLSYREAKQLHLLLGQEIARNECHACGRPLPESVTNG